MKPLTKLECELPEGLIAVRGGIMAHPIRKAVHADEIEGFTIGRKLCVRIADRDAWLLKHRRVLPRRKVSVEDTTDERTLVQFGRRRAS